MIPDRRAEAIPIAILAIMFGLALAAWPSAPDRILLLWQSWATPPRLGGKFEGLFGIPFMALSLYLLSLLLPAIDPRRAHYLAFRRSFVVIRTIAMATLLAAFLFVYAWSRGHQGSPSVFVSILAGTLMLIVGNYLPKVKSNWFFGVRTPWTLSSEESWRRTHRLAGWLLVAGSAIVLTVAVTRPSAGRIAIIGTLMPTLLISTFYSYVVWRRDRASVPGEG